MRGRFLHTLVLTDVATGWTECIALLTREQSLVVEALTLAAGQLPFPLKGFDTDNDSAFINEVVLDYCRRRGIEFTRSRPGRKNDQAWVEQKNGAVVRRAVGYERFEGVRAVDAMRRLFQSMRLFVNYFQPSFKLLKKEREGARVRKTYAPPATPCDRVLSSLHVSEERKSVLRQERANLDPIHLLKMMRDSQEELATLTNAQEVTAGETALTTDTDEFLAALPNLWKQGESRPTHRQQPRPTRTWRTRVDPFESVWPQVLAWLEKEPDLTAKEALERLQYFPGSCFGPVHLRTLQRRFQGWRRMMYQQIFTISHAGSGLESKAKHQV